jgi:hypothetical protein
MTSFSSGAGAGAASNRLKPGFLDQVFNSTIGLPQQFLWRVWRAMEDDEVDLWSEKGILDGALVPGFGMMDSHENDVMPDYMAEQTGLANKGESGFGSQITASILTDPLTYMTGGLSALAKLGKAATTARKFPSVATSLMKGAKEAGLEVGAYTSKLAPEAFATHLDEAAESLRQVGKHGEAAKLSKQGKRFSDALPGARQQAKVRGVEGNLDLGAAQAHTTDRKLALGLPILQRWGAKFDVAPNHQSWWKLFKDGVNHGGRSLGKSFLLKDITSVPYVGAMLKGSTMPFRHGMFGFKHGQDVRAVVPPAARSATREEAKMLVSYLSEDGGKALTYTVEAGFSKDPQFLGSVQAAFSAGIAANMTSAEAFKEALVATKIVGPRNTESAASLYGRLSGKMSGNKEFPDWEDVDSGVAAIGDLLGEFRMNHRKAAAVLDSGAVALTPAHSKFSDLEKVFEAERKDAHPKLRKVAETAYATGSALKGYLNQAFRSGSKGVINEAAQAKLLSDTARGNDEAEVLATAFFDQLKVAAQKGNFTVEELNKIVEIRTQLSALPEEISASFKSFQVNSSDPLAVIKAAENYLDRHRSTLTTIEKMLEPGGISNQASREKLLALFTDDVFPHVERQADELADGSKGAAVTLEAKVTDAAEPITETVIDYTPLERSRLQSPLNRHVVGGVVGQGPPRALGQVAGSEFGELAGKQAGTLTDAEIDTVLSTISKQGMRKMTGVELGLHALSIPAVRQFAKRHNLTPPEAVALIQRRSKEGAKTANLKRKVTSKQGALWDERRTGWTAKLAVDSLKAYGLAMRKDANGLLNVLTVEGALVRSASTKPLIASRSGYSTYAEAMSAARSFLKENDTYLKRYGPAATDAVVLKKIPATELEDLRRTLAHGGNDLNVLQGKSRVFDADELSPLHQKDYQRLTQLAGRRALPKEHALAEAGAILGKERTVRKAVRPVGEIGEIHSVRAGVGKVPISETMSHYANSRVLLNEIKLASRRASDAGLPFKVEPEVLADLEKHMNQTGTVILDLMDKSLPEMQKNFDIAQLFSSYNFSAARQSGTWLPGSPIAYLPRFMNKKSRTRVAQIVGEIDAADGQIMARLGAKSPQNFKRTMDDLSVDDLEDLSEELRLLANEKTSDPALGALHKRLDKELVDAGISVTGLSGKVPVGGVKGRLERDPFLNLIQRLGVANQHENLADYFNTLLKTSSDADGGALMVGGKVIGIVDNTGKHHSLKTLTSSTTKGRKGGKASVKQGTKTIDYVPKYIQIETADGSIQTIANAAMNDTGFGIMSLHSGLDEAAELAGARGSIGDAFAHASMRSDLHNSITEGLLKADKLEGMLGKQVVFGSRNTMTAAVKAASDVHAVTPQALRTFDSINYAIKSFQTIFRLPFHIANLSSGVFQASLAGATPKNLMLSYMDTMRLLGGNQGFAKRSSQLADLMDLGGTTTASLGIKNLLKGDKALIQQAARLHGGGGFSKHIAKQKGADAVEHLVLKHADGTQTDLLEFIQVAGEMQLYGTFASSMTRGSSTIADNVQRAKWLALDPKRLGKGKRLLKKFQNLAETSEVVNRTATALALIRGGHPMKRAIEMTRQAHVPYEKLTPFEKNYIKRYSVYYTFPRHYMPWATARFAEDPKKLANLTHLIRDQKVMTTQDGSPTAVVGNYRVNVGRLNANIEAAGMMAAFADRLVLPGVELLTGDSGLDRRFLRNAYSASGITSAGGVAGMVSDDLVPQGERTSFGSKSLFEEAGSMVWPVKALKQMMGLAPTKEEESPFVNYTPLEGMLTDSVFGVGLKKVRDQHEFRRARSTYRKYVSSLKLKIAATTDPAKREHYMESIRELTAGLQQMASEAEQKQW